jgi:hypothetical protein
MCNICGLNCGKGGALKKHVEEKHGVVYSMYKTCFYGEEVRNLITDSWDDSVLTIDGETAVTHVIVRRFVKNPGNRGVPRTSGRIGPLVKSPNQPIAIN